MEEQRVKQLVDKLSDLIDECENDFEAMVFNPDGTFELLLECHAVLSKQIEEVEE
ncbi:hypothetical protein [Streptococcus pluranimalium]|uniref:hypothetical protein n=1 Tax=Streptococcus pluranimalium TaxID=82348 RepID=UPI002A7D28DD|nr:hypothetical protein [Streptococcus pluranimalium]